MSLITLNHDYLISIIVKWMSLISAKKSFDLHNCVLCLARGQEYLGYVQVLYLGQVNLY